MSFGSGSGDDPLALVVAAAVLLGSPASSSFFGLAADADALLCFPAVALLSFATLALVDFFAVGVFFFSDAVSPWPPGRDAGGGGGKADEAATAATAAVRRDERRLATGWWS